MLFGTTLRLPGWLILGTEAQNSPKTLLRLTCSAGWQQKLRFPLHITGRPLNMFPGPWRRPILCTYGTTLSANHYNGLMMALSLYWIATRIFRHRETRIEILRFSGQVEASVFSRTFFTLLRPRATIRIPYLLPWSVRRKIFHPFLPRSAPGADESQENQIV